MATHSYEVLLHNVSHSDLILSLQDKVAKTGNSTGNKVIARPKFSNFREITKSILESVDSNDTRIASHLKYYRKVVNQNPIQYEVAPVESGEYTPVGFDLCQHPVEVNDIAGLRFRRDDKTLISSSSASIDGVYFPLLAILVPKWLETIQYRERAESCKLILYFVTGRGTANDTSARVTDNSTEWTGKLMTKFIQLLYPFIQVIHLHSHTNLFRYDENIIFVKRELLPSIDHVRDGLASALSTEKRWKDYFRVTLSFADGSSARVSAINASLKHYRPDYMHFWQLKTFWSELKLCDDDVEWHSHEEISTETAMSLQSIKNTVVDDIVSEMKRFMVDFEEVRRAGSDSNDLSSFWLRKTKKPVLAVLLVEKNGVRRFYRGTNMEVSMPTGSLCAERNAIGSALAEDLSLRRQDLRMIAVYSPPSLAPAASSSGTSATSVVGSVYAATAEMDARSMASAQNGAIHIPERAKYKPTESAAPDHHLPINSVFSNDSLDAPVTPRDADFLLSQESALSRDKRSHAGSQASPGLTGAVGHKRKIMNMSLFTAATESDGAKSAQVKFAASSQLDSSSSNPARTRDTPALIAESTTSAIGTTHATTMKAETSASDPFTPSPGLPTRRPRSRSNSQTLVDGTNGALVAPRSSRNATVRSSNRRVLTHSGYSPNSHATSGDLAPADSSLCIPCPLWERGEAGSGGLSALVSGGKKSLEPPTIIQVDDSDLNPMKPCGACHEWLKKIAEVNPRFSVITFTDVVCHGVYVEQIKD